MVLLVVLSEMGDEQILEELKVFHSKPIFQITRTSITFLWASHYCSLPNGLEGEAEAFILTWLKLTHEDERLYFF